jgi:hypothetical protein
MAGVVLAVPVQPDGDGWVLTHTRQGIGRAGGRGEGTGDAGQEQGESRDEHDRSPVLRRRIEDEAARVDYRIMKDANGVPQANALTNNDLA